MSLLYLTQGADYEKKKTRSSATADGPRDALSVEISCTTV